MRLIKSNIVMVTFIGILTCLAIVAPLISYCQGTDTYAVSLTVNAPANTTYTNATIPIGISTSGNETGLLITWNIKFSNGTWFYVANQTYTGQTTVAINENATDALFCVYVVGAHGVSNYKETKFTVSLIDEQAPTPTPPSEPSPEPTPESTPPPEPTQGNSLDFLLIGEIAASALAVAGGTSTFFIMKRKKVNEKRLKKFPPRDFKDWVIKRFNGKPSDPGLGVDGFTEGGQPLLIKQSENVSLTEVEHFIKVLASGKAQKGTIVAFNYDNDAIEGKMKAMDQDIELQMLNAYELVNKNYANKINDIARSQVTFDASSAYLAENPETAAFAETTTGLQNGVLKPRIFLSYSSSKMIDQIKQLLDSLHYDYVMGDKEEVPVPIPEKKFGLMKDCDCAIITISVVEQERRYSGSYILNPSVLTEISASYLKYNKQLALLVERKIELPSNLKGLKRFDYDNDTLTFALATELEKILAEFKKL